MLGQNHILYWYNHRSKKKQKMILKKIFLKLMNNPILRKTMENVRKHRDE